MRSSRRDIYRRKLAYPLITLLVAGGVMLWQRGQIASTSPASATDFVAFAARLMAQARAGEPVGPVSQPVLRDLFVRMVPEPLRSPDGGSLSFVPEGPVEADGSAPWMQSVRVSVPSGEGVILLLSIRDGESQLTGLQAVDLRAARGNLRGVADEPAAGGAGGDSGGSNVVSSAASPAGSSATSRPTPGPASSASNVAPANDPASVPASAPASDLPKESMP